MSYISCWLHYPLSEFYIYFSLYICTVIIIFFSIWYVYEYFILFIIYSLLGGIGLFRFLRVSRIIVSEHCLLDQIFPPTRSILKVGNLEFHVLFFVISSISKWKKIRCNNPKTFCYHIYVIISWKKCSKTAPPDSWFISNYSQE